MLTSVRKIVQSQQSALLGWDDVLWVLLHSLVRLSPRPVKMQEKNALPTCKDVLPSHQTYELFIAQVLLSVTSLWRFTGCSKYTDRCCAHEFHDCKHSGHDQSLVILKSLWNFKRPLPHLPNPLFAVATGCWCYPLLVLQDYSSKSMLGRPSGYVTPVIYFDGMCIHLHFCFKTVSGFSKSHFPW